MSATAVLSPPEPIEILTASPLPQLRRLIVTVNDGEVVITGRVTSYYMKQLAQETVRPIVGERRLRNRVEVAKAG
jgi:osmotically-inducible protein OsmY